jgi:hypothetical protein
MPVEEPQFGEVWTTTDISSGRIMQGIIADISPTRVLFVSLTGNRVAVPLSRLRTNWNFVQGAPRRTLPPCERAGCTNLGMIEYTRSDRSAYACPRHAPAGVQCRITANYIAPTEPRTARPGFECRSTPCPMCGDREPAEDIRISVFPARLWLCTSCNGRWVTIPRILGEDQNLEQLSYMIPHELGRLTYEVDSMIVLDPASWTDLRRSASAQADNTGAVPRIVLRDMQAFLDPTVVTEQVREHFHAILRVRSNAVRQVDRPVQRLGGSPNRGGVVGSQQNPVRRAPVLNDMVYRPTGPAETSAQAAALRQLRDQRAPAPARDLFEVESVETPMPDIAIDKESVWVQRMSGDLMVVLDIVKATDGSEAISFRRSNAEEMEPAVTMSRRDFLTYHRQYVASSSEAEKPKTPMVEISVDEEWECQDGSGLMVTQVDFRKEIVYGDDLKTKRHRQIPFIQFIAGRWRKIVRRSVYDRIRRPEINLAPGTDDEK